MSATNFTGQEFALDCGDWTCDDYGVTINDGYRGEGVACTHPIMPVQRLYNIDSGTEKLKIAYRKEHGGAVPLLIKGSCKQFINYTACRFRYRRKFGKQPPVGEIFNRY